MHGMPGDPRHRVDEPTLVEIDARLRRHGMPGEAELWHRVMAHPDP